MNQFTPAKTEMEYLKAHPDEESRLRAVIANKFAEHMPEFEIALHTGMRPSEQSGLEWPHVDLKHNLVESAKDEEGEGASHSP